ncbi:hypothetical protein PVAP13_3NG099800 [Panicum virgatum]|uniref:Uncharacterized protein n=1 Tax=Panicum virgatum TaxID=38727 RepID=A0A8T0UHA2_PANVG|nr:hypothetical protein PVAP13_3NG099800 [Panicum virgatum]
MAVKIWANNCISSKASKKLYEKGRSPISRCGRSSRF